MFRLTIFGLYALPAIAMVGDLAGVGPEGSLLGQGVIAATLALLGWFVKVWLGEMKAESREMRGEVKSLRVAIDQNTRVVSLALLEMAALIPGARPMLEDAKQGAEDRLRKEGA